MSEVVIGVVTGLVINIAVFPPLQLRPAEHAVRQWGNDIADALQTLADAVTDPVRAGPGRSTTRSSPPQRSRRARRHDTRGRA